MLFKHYLNRLGSPRNEITIWFSYSDAEEPSPQLSHPLFELHPTKDFNATKWNELGLATKYYNTDLHLGAFALPNYVKDLLK